MIRYRLKQKSSIYPGILVIAENNQIYSIIKWNIQLPINNRNFKKMIIWDKGAKMFNYWWVFTGQGLVKIDLCAMGRTADIFFFSSSFSQKDKNSKQKDSKQPPVLSCCRKKAKLLYNILLSCHKMLLLMHKVGLNALHIVVEIKHQGCLTL